MLTAASIVWMRKSASYIFVFSVLTIVFNIVYFLNYLMCHLITKEAVEHYVGRIKLTYVKTQNIFAVWHNLNNLLLYFCCSRTQWQMLKGKKLMISSRQDELGDEMLCPTSSTINTPGQAQPTCPIHWANWHVQVGVLTTHSWLNDKYFTLNVGFDMISVRKKKRREKLENLIHFVIQYTGSRLQRVQLHPEHPAITSNFFPQKKSLLIDINVKKVHLQRVPLITSKFLWIKLVVVSGTQCTMERNHWS